MPKLSREEKAAAQAVFRGEVPGKGPCEHCGGLHERACPRVKRVERHPNGNITGVTYFRRWDESGVVFPEDAFDPDDTEEKE
jgi:hypothetical protein